VALSQARCESERRANVLFLEIRKIREQLLDGTPGGKSFHDHTHGNANAPNAGLAPHYFRIDRYALKVLHASIIPHQMRSAGSRIKGRLN
jgi:hypothetical protein